MKKILFLTIFSIISLTLFAQTEFENKLSSLKGISEIQKLNTNVYPEKYEMYIEQNVNGTNSDKGKFKQRIIVGFRGYDRPTVIVTEGYSANYALSERFREELSELCNANIIVCEYRYFEKSCPEPLDWQYLTVNNSLDDLHNIRKTFGEIFKGKWLSTGVSKGGSTCTYYRARYPEDVDVSVAYVAPISHAPEDGRHEPFLNKKVGTPAERKAVKDCMTEFMKRKPNLLPMLDTFVVNHKYNFYLPNKNIFDYMVLEYEFSLWQWGTPISTIPSKKENDVVWFNYLIQMVEPSYFSYPSSYLPFFYQVVREFGYYGYDIKNIKKYTDLKSTKDYVNQIMLPQELRDVKFDPTLYKFTEDYLRNNDPKHIFIYGENDPWTASGVADWLNCDNKTNMKVYVQPNGSHLARINNMPSKTKEEIKNKISDWLK